MKSCVKISPKPQAPAARQTTAAERETRIVTRVNPPKVFERKAPASGPPALYVPPTAQERLEALPPYLRDRWEGRLPLGTSLDVATASELFGQKDYFREPEAPQFPPSRWKTPGSYEKFIAPIEAQDQQRLDFFARMNAAHIGSNSTGCFCKVKEKYGVNGWKFAEAEVWRWI
jgi:hypothetical protein